MRASRPASRRVRNGREPRTREPRVARGRRAATARQPPNTDTATQAAPAESIPQPRRQPRVPRALRGPREARLFASNEGIVVNLPRPTVVSLVDQFFSVSSWLLMVVQANQQDNVPSEVGSPFNSLSSPS